MCRDFWGTQGPGSPARLCNFKLCDGRVAPDRPRRGSLDVRPEFRPAAGSGTPIVFFYFLLSGTF